MLMHSIVRYCLLFVAMIPSIPIAYNSNCITHEISVHVDNLSDSVIKSKQKAIATARKKAFLKMIRNYIIKTKDYISIKIPPDFKLKKMVDYFVINEELFQDKRYIATITFYFNPIIFMEFIKVLQKERAKEILNKQNTKIPCLTTVIAKQITVNILKDIVVLPIYMDPDKLSMWRTDNSWWRYLRKYSDYKNSFIIPIGDLIDIMKISYESLALKRAIDIKNFVNRYNRKILIVSEIRKILNAFNTYELDIKAFDRDAVIVKHTLISLTNKYDIRNDDGIEISYVCALKEIIDFASSLSHCKKNEHKNVITNVYRVDITPNSFSTWVVFTKSLKKHNIYLEVLEYSYNNFKTKLTSTLSWPSLKKRISDQKFYKSLHGEIILNKVD